MNPTAIYFIKCLIENEQDVIAQCQEYMNDARNDTYSGPPLYHITEERMLEVYKDGMIEYECTIEKANRNIRIFEYILQLLKEKEISAQ